MRKFQISNMMVNWKDATKTGLGFLTITFLTLLISNLNNKLKHKKAKRSCPTTLAIEIKWYINILSEKDGIANPNM